jgi:uncharacterized OsmC-like protein
LSRYGQQLKIPIERAHINIKSRFWREGSALAGTLQAGCEGLETELDIRSSASPDQVARLVRIAENGCYVLQTLLQPVPVRRSVKLNGEPMDMVTDTSAGR